MNPLLLASAVSSIGGMFGGDDSAEYMNKAIQELIKVKIPDPEMQRLALDRFMSAGELSPELEAEISADPSAFEEIVQNQKYAQAQDKALTQLQSLGEEGGLSLTDKADLQEQLIASGNQDRANRDAITDDMARRGQLGSGMSLQAQLGGAQAAGDRDANSRLRALGGAQDRALDAIMGAGEMAGKMNEADYGRKSDVASARDRINQFNTQNAQDVQQRNVGMRNAAQATNLQNKQQLMNDNTNLGNQEQQYNKELQQQDFQNRMQKAQAKADVYSQRAGGEQQAGAQRRQTWGAVGSGLGQIGTGMQNQSNWDDWLKKTKGGGV